MASGYGSGDGAMGEGDVQPNSRAGTKYEFTGFIRVGNFSEACTIEVSAEVLTRSSPVFGRMFLNGGSVIFAGQTKRYIDLPGENAIIAYLVLKVLHGEKPWVDLPYEPHLLGLMADFAYRFDCLNSARRWFIITTWRCLVKIFKLRKRGRTRVTGIGPLLRVAYLVKDAFSFHVVSWLMFIAVEPEKVVHYASLAGLTEIVQRRIIENAHRYHREMTGKLWPQAVRDIINTLLVGRSLDEWPPCRSRLIAYYIDTLHTAGAFFIPKTLKEYCELSQIIDADLPKFTCGHELCQRTLNDLHQISNDVVELLKEVRGVCIVCLENGDRSGCPDCEAGQEFIERATVQLR